MSGMKDDIGKLRYDLIDAKALEQLAKVLTFGASKYSPDNWRLVDKEKYVAAVMRHFEKYRQGYIYDFESELPHLAHVMANLMFILCKDME